MADGQFARNLFRAPFNAQVERHLGPHPLRHTLCITAIFGALLSLGAGLLGAVATLPTATLDLAAYGAAVSAKQPGNLRERVTGFHEAVNLVSFFWAEVLVHQATSTWRLKRP